MKLLITCDFEDGTQVLIKDPATDADIRALARAKRDTPDAVLGVVCKTSETGPSRERLIRAGLIRSLELA